MTDLKTTQEISRTVDGTEYVRLATTGANWKATLTDIFDTLGGSGTPGGSDTQVQYNDNGTFAGASNLTISSGNPNVAAGGKYLYDGLPAIIAQSALGNFYEGNAGNLTGTGTTNLATGNAALSAITTGSDNTAYGASALQNLTTGIRNFAFGSSALLNANTGGNVAIGFGAGQALTTGGVLAIGQGACGLVQDGSTVYGIGAVACGVNVHGGFLLGIGANALGTCTADLNMGIGHGAGYGITSGQKNTIISINDFFDFNLTTGFQNIVIGYRNWVAVAGNSGQLTIGEYLYGTGLTGVAGTISTGKIGIGIKAPNFNLDVAGSLGCSEATAILHNSTTVTGGGTGNVPTLTAGPVTGNPTKWLPYDDNGTTRYIPSW